MDNPDIKLSCMTIYDYDASSVDEAVDDPDTPLCVISINDEDTVFISPLKDDEEDNKFVVFNNGYETKFKSKEDLLKEFELDMVDSDKSEKFFSMCENWMKPVFESVDFHLPKNIFTEEKVVNGVHYGIDPGNGLYIDGKYLSSLSASDSRILYESLTKLSNKE